MNNESSGRGAEQLRKLVHDLRNRLNNIAMNAELAKLEIGSFDPITQSASSSSGSEVLSCLTKILVACKESADAIDAIAAISLLEASDVARSNNAPGK